MKQKVVIIGSGKIGQAIGSVIPKSRAQVEFWDKEPGKVKKQGELSVLVSQADILLLCTPSWCMREAVKQLQYFLNKKTIVVSVAKGIEKGTKLTMDQLLDKLIPGNTRCFLGGPMLAREMRKKMPGFGVLGTTSTSAYKTVSALFDSTSLKLSHTSDIKGLIWSSILKNVYSLGLGIGAGLKWGDNQRGWYVSQATQEMSELVSRFGGRGVTAYGLAGLGDFVATGSSKFSSNRSMGQELVKNRSCSKPAEGIYSTMVVHQRVKSNKVNFPILNAIKQSLSGRDAKKSFAQLI